MESSQEFMLLSLLNLYVTYVDVKSGRLQQPKRSTYNKFKIWNSKPTSEDRINYFVAPKSQVTAENEVAQTDQPPLAPQAANVNIEETVGSNRPARTRRKRNPRGMGRRKRSPKAKPRRRRFAIRPINRDRCLTGYYRKVFITIKKMDQEQLFLHTRMSKPIFDWLLSFMQKSLNKKRQRVKADERLAITLEYLAYATPMQSIAFKYKLGKSTIRIIVLETCSLLWELLSPIYVSEPTTSQYCDIADDFKSKWDIPNCVGAIDGKHVSIRVPKKKVKNSLSSVNIEDVSMLLMGVCDSHYKFMAAYLGEPDSQDDEASFKFSPFGSAVISNQLPLPSSKPLFDSSPPFPHYFINNNSLSLRKNIMCPYTETETDANKTIFNYKMSRALAITENTFGVLTARWRVLLNTMEFLPESCRSIILACVALHNYIMANDDDHLYCPANFVDREGEFGNIELGEWRNELKKNGDQPLRSMASSTGRSTYEAKHLRDTLANFFGTEAITYEIDFVE